MTRAGLARLAVATAASVCMAGIMLSAQGNGNRFSARLAGAEEVPVVSTAAQGSLTLTIDEAAEEIHYELSFENLSSTVAQAHIHIAQPAVNGGIVLWLCEGTALAPAPLDPPTCPQSGTVTGTLTAADVAATPPAQQIAAGEFDEVVALIKAGLAYGNVHTAISGGGEIRGQLRAGAGHN